MAAVAKAPTAPQRWTLTVPGFNGSPETSMAISGADTPRTFARTLDGFTARVREASKIVDCVPNYWGPLGAALDNLAKKHRGEQSASKYVAGLLAPDTHKFWMIERTVENYLSEAQGKAEFARERENKIDLSGFAAWFEEIRKSEVGPGLPKGTGLASDPAKTEAKADARVAVAVAATPLAPGAAAALPAAAAPAAPPKPPQPLFDVKEDFFGTAPCKGPRPKGQDSMCDLAVVTILDDKDKSPQSFDQRAQTVEAKGEVRVVSAPIRPFVIGTWETSAVPPTPPAPASAAPAHAAPPQSHPQTAHKSSDAAAAASAPQNPPKPPLPGSGPPLPSGPSQ